MFVVAPPPPSKPEASSPASVSSTTPSGARPKAARSRPAMPSPANVICSPSDSSSFAIAANAAFAAVHLLLLEVSEPPPLPGSARGDHPPSACRACGRQKRCDPSPLLVRKPKKSAIFNASPQRGVNHINVAMGIPLMCPDPNWYRVESRHLEGPA